MLVLLIGQLQSILSTKMKKRKGILLIILLLTLAEISFAQQWSVEKANDWYQKQPWLVGCNFLPSSAINQIDMWQDESWDPATIKKELTWAEELGFNCVRVYLHDLVYAAEKKLLLDKMDQFLVICEERGIKPLFVFFDDCHYAQPKMGKQPDRIAGVHNSGWKQSPGYYTNLAYTNNSISRKKAKSLEKYVKGVINHFKDDNRILGWDLYNEAGREGNQSDKLVADVWRWAWNVRPSQPLTACVSGATSKFAKEINAKNSDIYTFHGYSSPDIFTRKIENAVKEADGRPVICTEYMGRTRNNTFQNVMPKLKERNIGCINWGLVDGKSGTKWSWKTYGQKNPGDGIPRPKIDPVNVHFDPELWFHDILKKDGKPYIQEEVDFIKKMTGKSN